MASRKKKVFITGGTGSVGKALVRAFSAADYDVTFQYYKNRRAALKLAEETDADLVSLDFSKTLDLPSTSFNIVINNAGINIFGVKTHKVTPQAWQRTFAVNVTTPFFIVRKYLPRMVRMRWGRIINISSIYGLRAVEGNLPYTASKHALSGLTKTIAKEYGGKGITANEICPGPIESELINRIAQCQAPQQGMTIEEYIEEICEEIPSGRMAKPCEVAALALFLASEKASYINGSSLTLDGGLIA